MYFQSLEFASCISPVLPSRNQNFTTKKQNTYEELYFSDRYVLCSVILTLISYIRDITLTRVARELAKCKLDLVDVLEVRLDKRGTERAGDVTSPIERETKAPIGNRIFFVHQ
jgi:hypothetical protein